MADAGFFFAPTSSAIDNTTCFICAANIDGWEAQDDPLEEHKKFSPHCGWAIVRSIEQNEGAEELGSVDPMSEEMVEARRATFQGKWPHEEKRGWVCKTQKVCYFNVPEMKPRLNEFFSWWKLDGISVRRQKVRTS